MLARHSCYTKTALCITNCYSKHLTHQTNRISKYEFHKEKNTTDNLCLKILKSIIPTMLIIRFIYKNGTDTMTFSKKFPTLVQVRMSLFIQHYI